MKKELTKNCKAWLLFFCTALLTGAITGGISAIFGRVLIWIGNFRGGHLLWCLPFLPIAGLLIVFCYGKFGKNAGKGMGLIFDAANEKEEKIPLRLVPMVTIATWITHLTGGSAGREGVAVQIGGTVGNNLTHWIKPLQNIPHSKRIMTIAGMAAGFSGLFHTPIAATAFALEVLAVGEITFPALIPTAISAITAYYVSCLCGLETFHVDVPSTTQSPLSIGFIILGICTGLIGGLFAYLLRTGKKVLAEKIKNPLIRIGVGGVVIAIALFFCWHGRYTGLGTNLIQAATSGEQVYCYDFLLKLLFTVITLSVGFQGGEVTPLFAIGATFGVWIAPLVGIPTILAAGLGYAAVFGSASNTLFAPIFIGTEVFGYEFLPYFAVVCTLSRIFSGGKSIYGNQKALPIWNLFSKQKG